MDLQKIGERVLNYNFPMAGENPLHQLQLWGRVALLLLRQGHSPHLCSPGWSPTWSCAGDESVDSGGDGGVVYMQAASG